MTPSFLRDGTSGLTGDGSDTKSTALSAAAGRVLQVEQSARSGESARLVESWFPFASVSRLVAADRRSKDPVYGVHKWFARRPPTLVRALLLASHLGADAGADTFWNMHTQPGSWLSDAVVYDPFMGGGTSLVESARMGATVVGRDVDPIAVAIVGSELHGPAAGFDDVSKQLLGELGAEFGSTLVGPDTDWIPLHWFWLLQPTCANCNYTGLLYKDLIIATSSGRAGAVVRDHSMHAFCPECQTVYALDLERKEIQCCGRRHKIRSGTYRQGKYHCPGCKSRLTYEDLGAARTNRVLVAIEETRVGSRRRIRSATDFDRELVASALDVSADTGAEFDVPLEVERRDRRPVSAGFTSTRTLFTARQWAVFTTAFDKVRSAAHSPALERDLTLMLTGALSSNNILCGYARDWGRLAPLFSVRGFSLPALSVELNPFHPSAGRGTLRSARIRMMERSAVAVRRAYLVGNETDHHAVRLPVQASAIDVICGSADDTAGQADRVATVCVTDPPYFDYIAYSELSEFFRTWLRDPSLGGAPLLPSANCTVDSFATGLGAALKATLGKLEHSTPLVFTYHSAHVDAWTAIGDALDIADLAVVALWPVLADPHMGHHAADGNCEWDVVVVARRRSEVDDIAASALDYLPNVWLAEIEAAQLRVGRNDRTSFEHAWSMSKTRFARVTDLPTPGRKRRRPPRLTHIEPHLRSG
jgi:putative DNA methylase